MKTGFLTIGDALRQGTKLLEEAGVAVPRLTAEVLLSHALGRERVYLFGYPEDELSELSWIHYGRYLHQRMNGTPTQYITRKQEFFGRDFAVSPDVLIPRPETEHVVATALELLTPGDRVVDVGCGSGAIAVTLALEKAVAVKATDISESAVAVAARNARNLGARVDFAVCDLLTPVQSASMDMVVSNPPYVGLHEQDGLQREVRDHEPHVALFGGPAGSEIYERLIIDSERVLRAGGWLVLELGWKSLAPVRSILGKTWREVETIGDLNGIPRVLRAKLTP